ncbi:MAG TPA: protein kinase [Thermoflexia bacterium]|nr:protein kinase [Thermoflexia bacterium]
MTLTQGQMIGKRYRVVSLLGQGGMGAVYRAWDTRLNIPVALKEMIPQPGLDPQTLAQLRQQFQQEAQVLARLKHNYLVSVTDFFEERGNAYLAMEFVQGENLAERIEREGALPEEQVTAWAKQLLDALAYCHSQGIIHRDVKPQNVIITPEGAPPDARGGAVLVDFGLVKLWDPNDPRTKTAMRGMGTPEYAPPEQYSVRGQHTDPRSDIYSLGATLYHALTGQAPLTATERMADPSDFMPPRRLNLQVSAPMEATVLRAMKLPRDERFDNTQEMAAALEDGAPGPARPTVAPKRKPRPKHQATKVLPKSQQAILPRKRHIPVWAWAVGGIIALALVAAAAFGIIQTSRSALMAVVKPTPTSSPVSPIARSLTACPLFVSNRDGKREIYYLTEQGELVRITHTPSDSESWSPVPMPDGAIIFTSNRDNKREIYHLAETGDVTRITNTPGNGESWEPAPMLDGSILFTSDRDGKREIYHLSAEGEIVQITNTASDGESWGPSSTPDGDILFTSDRDGKREVHHLAAEGEVVQITNTPGDGESWGPSSTPNGDILFTSDRNGKREIYHLTGTGNVTRITNTPGNSESWDPVLTPDGVIFLTSNRGGKREVYHLTAEGEIVQITNTPGNSESWSPTQ